MEQLKYSPLSNLGKEILFQRIMTVERVLQPQNLKSQQPDRKELFIYTEG